MSKVKSLLTVERKITNEAEKRDTEILTSIAKELPSTARVKIYKKEEDNKSFIASILAEDFGTQDPHDYIKNKYAKKYGGGEYIIDLLDSAGNNVSSSVVSLIGGDEEKPVHETKQAKIVEEALEMREEAFEKVKEAEKEKREAERMRYDTVIEGMNKQWEIIQGMYQSQLEALKGQVANAPDPNAQIIVQMQIDKVAREFDMARAKFESDLTKNTEGKASSDKIFDLVNTLIPLILQKSAKEEKDPIDELNKTISLVNTISGGKKDMVESMIENPQKFEMFKKLMGIEDNSRKKSMFEDIFDNPEKMAMFRHAIGIETKKDMLSEMIESKDKLEAFKKLTGNDELITTLKNMIPATPVTAPKGFLEELIETTTKLEAAKPVLQNLLGVKPQPAKSWFELFSTFLSSPHVAQMVNNVMNGMVTVQLVKSGRLSPQQMSAMGIDPNAGGYSGADVPAKREAPTPKPQEIKNKSEELKEKNTNTEKIEVNENMNIEEMFKASIATVIIEAEKAEGELDSNQFIDKVSDKIIEEAKKNPMLIIQIMRIGLEELEKKMSIIIQEILSIPEEHSSTISKAIIDSVKNKF